MALYSTVKYKSIRGAGFRKEADLSSLRTELRGQMDRKIGEALSSSTTRFFNVIGNSLASTTSFEAVYDGGSSRG